jgi:hypothetical protein
MNKKYIIATLMLAFFGISGTSAQYVWNLAGMPAYDIELEVEYYTDLLETEDNSTWLTTNSGGTASVWLGRTLQPVSYNTLALPFSMDIPTGWDVKELTSSSFESTTGELTLNFSDATTIEAGKPYLVKISGSEAITLTGYDDVTIGNANPSTTTAVDFIPTLGKTLVTGPTGDESNPEAVLYLGANNKLHHPTVVNNSNNEASYIKGFRAYFQFKGASAAGARAYSINLGDGSTGVSSLTPDPSPKGVGSGYYSLDGRKLNGQPTVKGVYIKNGKKIVIK